MLELCGGSLRSYELQNVPKKSKLRKYIRNIQKINQQQVFKKIRALWFSTSGSTSVVTTAQRCVSLWSDFCDLVAVLHTRYTGLLMSTDKSPQKQYRTSVLETKFACAVCMLTYPECFLLVHSGRRMDESRLCDLVWSFYD